MFPLIKGPNQLKLLEATAEIPYCGNLLYVPECIQLIKGPNQLKLLETTAEIPYCSNLFMFLNTSS
jgi:hypothetical protein